MKKIAIALVLALVPAMACAKDVQEKELNKYGLSKYAKIADANTGDEGLAPVSERLDKQVQALGKYAVDTRVDLNGDVADLTKRVEQIKKETDYKIADLERRLSGVQKQVTVLHAKKADQVELQKTRDQAANVSNMLRKKVNAQAGK